MPTLLTAGRGDAAHVKDQFGKLPCTHMGGTLLSFRPPPGLEKMQKHDFQGEAIAKADPVNADCEEGRAGDISTMATAPPSPGGTPDSCDDGASDRSARKNG